MSLIKGTEVVFASRVYEYPYAPYYDEYAGHIFRILKIHDYYSCPHFELECISDPDLKVKGHVHGDVLIENK